MIHNISAFYITTFFSVHQSIFAEKGSTEEDNNAISGQNDQPHVKVSPVSSKAVKISPQLTRLKSFRRGFSKRSLLSYGRISPCSSELGKVNATKALLYVHLFIHLK